MATKTDFTEDEWQALQKGVTGAGMLVSAGHRDFTDSFGEAAALAKELASQRTEASSELIRELVHVRGTGFSLFTSPAEVEQETLAALEAAVGTLESKAPGELDTYRALVLDVAQSVAQAKGGIREEETTAIERIRRAMASSETRPET